MLKDTDEADVTRAILAVAHGEAIFSLAIATRVLASFATALRDAVSFFPTLTDRDREVLCFTAPGKSNPAI